jgi:hypothetical protein
MERFTKVITESDLKKILGEGLIKTVSPLRVKKLVEKFSEGDVIVEIVEDISSGYLDIHLPLEKRTEKYINRLINLLNNMGYFFSTWFKEGSTRFEKVENLIYEKTGIIRFEPKFDVEYMPKNRYLYHVTDRKFLPKILKYGLVPKSKNKVSKHPDRIYLVINKNFLIDISLMMEEFIPIEDQVYLRIDLKNLPIFLRIDSQFDGGVYTTDNIPPNNIEVIDLDVLL